MADDLRAERERGDAAAIAASAAQRQTAIAATQAAIKRAERPLAEAEAAATDITQGLDQHIRELMGPLPWVRYTGLGQVVKVFKTDGYCTVTMSGDSAGAQTNRRVRIGAGTPKVGKAYPVFQPYQLPSAEHALLDGLVPAGDPFLHAPGGLWLYYATELYPNDTDTNLGITRIPWPPLDAQAAEVLCEEPYNVAGGGFILNAFLGVDGVGNLWFSVQTPDNPPVWGVYSHADSGHGPRSNVIHTGDVQYVAVDCTPGASNLLGWTAPDVTTHITRSTTPLPSVQFAEWLHLQTDGGTTFAGGDPGPHDFGYGTGTALGSAAIDPGTHPSHGHYIPPNDGTFAGAHYHWFQWTAAPDAPFALTYADDYVPTLSLYVAKGTVESDGSVTLHASIVQSLPLDGPAVIETFYTASVLHSPDLIASSFAYLPDAILSADSAIAAILGSGSINAAYHGLKAYPLAQVVDSAGRSRYRTFAGRRPFLFTVLEGEQGGALSLGQVATVFPTAPFSDPDRPWRNFGAHPTPVQPPQTTPIEVNTLGLLGPATTSGQAVWALGPGGAGRLQGLVGWWANPSDIGNPTRATWQQIAGAGFVATATVYAQGVASGRSALDILALKSFISPALAYSLDGGTSWADVPITLPFYPGASIYSPTLHERNYSYIVEAP